MDYVLFGAFQLNPKVCIYITSKPVKFLGSKCMESMMYYFFTINNISFFATCRYYKSIFIIIVNKRWYKSDVTFNISNIGFFVDVFLCRYILWISWIGYTLIILLLPILKSPDITSPDFFAIVLST